MENKMYAKPMYKCSFCDGVYEDAIERAKCELQCAKRIEEEAKKAAELKKKEEKDARYKEVVDAYDRFQELLDKYTEDYGTFIMNNNAHNPTFGKLIDHFWF